MTINITVDDLEDSFFKREAFYNRLLRTSKVKEILRIDSEENISISAAMSKFFINSIYDPAQIREALLEVCRVSYNLSSLDVFDDLYKSCIQYGKILELFENDPDGAEIINFYDRAKNSSIYRSNPYFWLQYGVARWRKRELDLTQSCIAEARSVGRNIPGFKPFQIDHFEASVKIDTMTESTGPFPIGDYVVSIYDVISRQIDQTETKFYPFKLGYNLYRFIKGKQNKLTAAQWRNFMDRSRAMSRRIATCDKQYDYPDEFMQFRSALNAVIGRENKNMKSISASNRK